MHGFIFRLAVMLAGCSCAVAVAPAAAGAADWPMWRYGAQRGAVTPQALPADLRPAWTRQLPPPIPAWPATQPRLQFDTVPQAVVAGARLFVPCTVNDSVSAFSTRTGALLWRFQTDGPVRFAPLAHAGRVYFVSDDGHLYCVDARDGALKWRLNGGPTDRRVLGHGRLVSSWPARGGVVLHDDRLFFAASIWPFMGVFLHAVEPATGRVLWTNSGTGTNYTTQPHGTPSFATVAPQGHLAATGNSLIVPGGRSVPAIFDTRNGQFQHFEFYNKGHGGHAVMAGRQAYFVGGKGYDLRDGMLAKTEVPVFCGPRQVVFVDGKQIRIAPAESQVIDDSQVDRTGKKKAAPPQIVWTTLATHTLAPAETGLPQAWLFRAGSQLWGLSGTSTIVCYDLPQPTDAGGPPIQPAWQTRVEGDVVSALAADDRLFVFTADARVHCFAAESPAVVHHQLRTQAWPSQRSAADWKRTLDVILEQETRLQGIAVCLGVRDGGLVRQLLSRTRLSVIAVDPDPQVIRQLRTRLVDQGWYGRRVTAHVGHPGQFPLPPYLARLVVSERAGLAAAEVQKAFRSLRPYGGAAYLPVDTTRLARLAQDLKQPQARVSEPRGGGRAGLSVLRRVGPLPQAGQWTHQYGNAAQTGISQDSLVQAPLGLLWFGGLSHEGVLPRHGHGPSPQVAGGRLVIEGVDFLRCVDVYTGRLLWQKDLPKLGEYYNKTSHFTGASEIGSNYVTLADRVYVVYGTQLLELDAETGETLFDFRSADPSLSGVWGVLAVHGDLLVATSSPMSIQPSPPSALRMIPWAPPTGVRSAMQLRVLWNYLSSSIFELAAAESSLRSKLSKLSFIGRLVGPNPLENLTRDLVYYQDRLAAVFRAPRDTAPSADAAPRDDKLLLPAHDIKAEQFASASRRLVVFDRVQRKLLWHRAARYGMRHNNIALGGRHVFCIDALSQAKQYALARRGAVFNYRPTLYALDARTGRVAWKADKQITGTFLNYSAEHDMLIQGGSQYRDRALDESGRGLIAYRGRDGEVLWKRPHLEYSGPCLLKQNTIITNGNGGFALDIHTGQETGWKYVRAYGCNTAIGSKHLLTFRSGAAGFCDLLHDAGTGNLGGFRSSCTNNLIPADGVLSAPDYTRTCVCSYQNQASLALIHMPEAEFWTFGAKLTAGRLGINFGAPGDRRSPDGTLWLDYPSVGGATERIIKKLKVDADSEPLQTFRQHASVVRQGDLRWVASSGVFGLRRIVLPARRKKSYRVRLVFLEPENVSVGDRVFDISVAGQRVSRFDIVRRAGGTGRQFTREFSVRASGKTIEVRLTPRGDRPPVLCGIELIELSEAASAK